MSFGSRLSSIRKENKLSREELALKLEYSPKTIAAYENGQNKPNYDVFIKLCKIFNRNPDYFMQDDIKSIRPQMNPEDKKLIERYYKLPDHDKEIVNYILSMEKQELVYSDETTQLIDMGKIIPIKTYTQPVSAGKGNIYLDDNPVSTLYPLTQISSKADYCVKISGDSMLPNYLNGDTVYVSTKEQVKHGNIGIFLYNGEGFCKKYYEQDGVIKLISLNPNKKEYSPIIIENNSFACQGKVIGRFHAD